MIKNLEFHKLIELEIQNLKYGTITVNVVVRNGVANLSTSNLVSQRRIKFGNGNSLTTSVK
jgi:hypothetical protein